MIARIRDLFVRLLMFLRIVDEHDGGVSLTNIAFMAAIAKVIISAQCSIVDLGALSVTLLSYGHKRVTKAKVQDNAARVDALEQQAKDATGQLASLAESLKTVSDRLVVVDNRTKGRGQP